MDNKKAAFHHLTTEQTLKKISSNIKGLSAEEVKTRLAKYGSNEIPEKKQKNFILIFLKQFNSILIYILLSAAVISYFFDHLVDVYVIVAVILINATIGFVEENRAEKAIKALKKMIVLNAKVYREGELLQIRAKELVPGDIILLEEGDRIPADARLVDLKNLRTVESSLTGESLPSDKNIRVLPQNTILAERRNMVWMGTFVASGNGTAVVVSTGKNTAIGQVAAQIEKIKREKGHFREKTDKLAKQMGVIALISAAFIFLVGFFIRGFSFPEIFLFTVASLVSAIPEGLPAVLAVVLAIGAYRMSKRKAIVRNLPSAETLGVVTTILTDKTGTLTENTMTAEKIILPGQKEITVTGEGWSSDGEFIQGKIINAVKNHSLSKLLHVSLICNNSRVLRKEGKKEYEILGDPTEAALVVLAEKAGLKRENLEENNEKRIDDMPFNTELKYRASLSALIQKENNKEIYVIGAPESVLSSSNYFLKNKRKERMLKKDKDELFKRMDKLTDKAMRVLAIAYKEVSKKQDSISEDNITELVFIGFVGMKDPPRPEVKEAIAKARTAGIRVIMATGDNKNTAIAVAKEIGLISKIKSKNKIEALTEQELRELSDKQFVQTIKEVSVFARLTPAMKLKIASTLQKQGNIVAMTGDGVNDAPALKKADIGISMGIIGTDVARESSEIVLADDNFASIINAIEEGRIVFTNTRQTAFYLITTNFAETVTIIGTMTFGLPLPLLATQILWLNLVTDGVSVAALATEPSHGDVLDEPPKNAKEDILSKEILPFLFIMVGIMAVATFLVFNYFLPQGIEKARTASFAVMAFTQLFNVLNMRSLKKSLFKIGLFSNKYILVANSASLILLFVVFYTSFFQQVFNFVSLRLIEIAIIILISSTVLWAGEIYKKVKKY